MAFSYSGVWSDTVRVLRANAALLLAVAGAFLFLPQLVLGYALPAPTGAQGAAAAEAAAGWYSDNFGWFALATAFGFLGNLVILILALDDSRPTVGGAIAQALRLLWRYFLVSLLSGLAGAIAFLPALVALGAAQGGGAGIALIAMLLMIPGLYVFARLSMASPVVVAEPLGVVATVRRSVALTKGSGWAILGMMMLVLLAFGIVSMAVTVVFGSLLGVIDLAAGGGGGLGGFLLLIVTTAVGAAFPVVLFVLLAVLYRRLASASPAASGT